MKKRLIPAALCALAAACTSSGALYESGNPPAVRMAASEIVRNPSPTNLDGIPAGKVKWNYTTGLELLAIADAGRMSASRSSRPMPSVISTRSCVPAGRC